MGDYMKKLILALAVFISAIIVAADIPSDTYMSISEQEDLIVNIAKKLRRDHWVRGYEDVTSSDTFVSREWLDNYFSQPDMFTNFLNGDEIAEVEKCYGKENCELYYISVSSSYMGGYGIEGSFILLFTETGEHLEISHTVYAE